MKKKRSCERRTRAIEIRESLNRWPKKKKVLKSRHKATQSKTKTISIIRRNKWAAKSRTSWNPKKHSRKLNQELILMIQTKTIKIQESCSRRVDNLKMINPKIKKTNTLSIQIQIKTNWMNLVNNLVVKKKLFN